MNTLINNKKIIIHWLSLLLIVVVLMPISALQADDVEVYLKKSEGSIAPNVLFILDESGSMTSSFTGTTNSRMTVLKNAMTAVINDPDLGNVNTAILGYSTNKSPRCRRGRCTYYPQLWTDYSRIIETFAIIDDDRSLYIDAIDEIQTSSYTPSVTALSHGMQWFEDNLRGAPSPLAEERYCAANSIVFLTDGQPNSNSMSSYKGESCTSSYNTFWSSGRCAREIAAWGENTDLKPEWAGIQNILTYTVSMLPESATREQTFLREIAREGHGYSYDCEGLSAEQTASCEDDTETGFFQANSAEDLVDALKAIVADTQSKISYAYNAPSVPMNPSDIASSGDYIYVPLLVPTVNQAWNGNLKKYKILRDSDGNISILGLGGANAIETDENSPKYNQFLDNVKSYWDVDGEDDGNNPLLGGVVEQLAQFEQIDEINDDGITDFNTMANADPPLIRQIYTYIKPDGLGGGSSSKELSGDVNRIIPSNDPDNRCSENTDIVPAMLNLSSTNACHEIMEWLVTGSYNTGEQDASGNDIIDYKMGAPIHTKPVVLTYGTKKIIYIPTSDGMLHAFRDYGSTVTELWTYMPEELLYYAKNLKTPAEQKPLYGLDGNITVVHEDANNNFIVDGDEEVKLVFGQRRGGKNYYSIDVSKYKKPLYVAQISGPEAAIVSGGVEIKPAVIATTGFEALGQTWSQPVYKMLDHNNEKVLIFGGGYDAAQDISVGRVVDDEGNYIYIVDAKTLAFKARIKASSSSIPAGISAVDMDSDGLVDRLYAADVGGRIIRADIDQNDGTWTSYVLSDVGGSPNVKFFNAPAIAYESGSNGFVSINIGTGDRSKPLEKTLDSFFMIKDSDIWHIPTTTPVAIEKDDLLDVDGSYLGSVNESFKNAKGWKFSLPLGFKVFSKASVLDYVVVFTAYGEIGSSSDICKADGSVGESWLYALNMLTGSGVFRNVGSHDPVTRKRINIQGMPPEPVLVSDSGETGTGGAAGRPARNDILVGLETAVSFPARIYQLNWEEVLESSYTPSY